jgi:acyl-CoA dehydrogenase
MNVQFDFSEEQEMMRGEARRLLVAKSPTSVMRAVLESERSHDASLWKTVSENGWTGIAIPESDGGAGAGYLELCVLAEELGRALAPIPFSSSIYLAAEALLLGDDAELRSIWLPRMASGEVIGTLALSEGAGFPAFHRMSMRAAGSGDAVKLHGVKTPVLDGMAANVAVVAAQGERGVGLYWVELEQPGVDRRAEPGIDDSRPLARIAFSGATARRIGHSNAAMLETLLNRAAVLFAFEQLGGAQAALDMAVDYAKQRYAFGRPIGGFQAIKHKLADLYAGLELTRSNCFYAAWALSTNDASLAEAAACARLSATKSYFDCAKENIQVHGGMGFTWEVDGHLHYRRARLLGSAIGGQGYWREALVRTLEAADISAIASQPEAQAA